MITSSCGMNHLPRQIAFGKLKAMAGAAQILSGRALHEPLPAGIA